MPPGDAAKRRQARYATSTEEELKQWKAAKKARRRRNSAARAAAAETDEASAEAHIRTYVCSSLVLFHRCSVPHALLHAWLLQLCSAGEATLHLCAVLYLRTYPFHSKGWCSLEPDPCRRLGVGEARSAAASGTCKPGAASGRRVCAEESCEHATLEDTWPARAASDIQDAAAEARGSCWGRG